MPASGKYVTIQAGGLEAKAFVPDPLPPPINWTQALHDKFDKAALNLGRLDSVSTLLPETALLRDVCIRQEAIFSSKIEGIHVSLSDLLVFEQGQWPKMNSDDVQEVSNYVQAIRHGLRLLREGQPVSIQMIREIHGILFGKGRGESLGPGQFRRIQNWIGGRSPCNAIFVPPPPDQVTECMNQFQRFLSDQPEQTRVLLKAALAHVQFESIHPFIDGNGRAGRLLITLLLCEQKVLQEPMLYFSAYIMAHQQCYYELLNNTHKSTDWVPWLEFFADGVIEIAIKSMGMARELHALSERDHARISEHDRKTTSESLVHNVLLACPIVTSDHLISKTGLSRATVHKVVKKFMRLGMVREGTARRRDHIFVYSEYTEIMKRGVPILN